MRQTIKDAVIEKKETPVKTSAAKANIIENRAQERADGRSAGLNGTLPTAAAPGTAEKTSSLNVASGPNKPSLTNKFKQLWSKVDATSRN